MSDSGDQPSGPKERRSKSWITVAVVAALIGGAVGAGVVWAGEGNSGSTNTLTIKEGNAPPGPAVLSGNVSIPQLVHHVLPAVVSIDVKSNGEEDQGTGMIITSSGEVLTNNHVVELAEGGGTITVTESGTTKAQPATLVGADPSRDVALLQVKGASGLPTITFGRSTKAQVGDAVVAIGNALGLAAGTPTVTQGIISALGRTVTAGSTASASTETLTDMVQTDAAINPGNSGGPLIDSSGQVIAMNTAVAGSTSDGSSAQNIGFAIPSATVESLLPELIKGGTINSGGGVLGVDVTSMTSQLQQQYGFTPSKGAVVLDVVPGSPADKAGLQQGDVIVAIDSSPIASGGQLQTVLGKDKPGQSVQLTYYVGNEKHTVSITLESQSEEQQQAQNAAGSIGSGIPGFGGTGGSSGGLGG
jgi:putative serine protease PepD